MASSHKIRYKLGQLMGIIALTAILLAAMPKDVGGAQWILQLIARMIALAGVSVLVYNIRLSGWIWVAVVGYAGPMLILIFDLPRLSVWRSAQVLTVSSALHDIFSLLFVVGLALAFRDVRRELNDKVESSENPEP
jgi:hypothetical protein